MVAMLASLYPALTMTEYDFSPEAMERYMSNQNRIEQWVGSSEQHHSAGPYTITPSDYGRGGTGYMSNDASYGRRSPHSRRDRGGRRAEHQTENYYDPQSMSQGLGMTSSGQMLMEPNRAYDSSPSRASFPPPHTLPHPIDSRQASINGGAPLFNPPLAQQSEIPPLEEHYTAHISRPSSPIHRIPSRASIPLSASNPFPAHSTGMYSTPPIPMSTSASGYAPRYSRRAHSFTESYRSYSSRSYSTDSYSSRSSRSYDRRPYTTVLPSSASPTVIQPSRRHPIIVPINGGVGGYVVVPAVGQSLRVFDPERPYKDRSFIDRILSPSTWGIGRKYRRK